jgi:hypothetical protein
MRVMTLGLLAIVGLAIDQAGCSSSNTSSSCTNIAGQWTVSGCSNPTCSVSQNVCTVQISCSVISFAGTVSGSSLDITAFGADGGVVQTCQGTISGATMTGMCQSGTGVCSYTATKQ